MQECCIEYNPTEMYKTEIKEMEGFTRFHNLRRLELRFGIWRYRQGRCPSTVPWVQGNAPPSSMKYSNSFVTSSQPWMYDNTGLLARRMIVGVTLFFQLLCSTTDHKTMLYLGNQLYYFKYAHNVKGETRPKSEAKNTSASNPVLYKSIPTTSLSFKQY